MKRSAYLLIIALLCFQLLLSPAKAFTLQPVPAQAAGKYADKIKAFEDFVRAQMATERVPGLSIGFIKDDFMWVKGYGYADLENKIPAKAESAYRLASVTKPMTALAVLQLAEKGKINLDAEVQTYVPYFPKKPWPVTVRQVLGHLGGISHYKNPANELHIKENKTTREAIALFENFDLVAEPGTRYSYSSYGYNLLGAIIESASGKSYGEYMRENVWQPLGMNDTRMDNPTDLIPNRVRGYQMVNGEIKNSEFIDISSRFAAGGTRSTVVDLLKFAKGINSGQLLSKESYDAMFTSLATKDGRYTDYGLGWETTPLNGHFTIAHSGGQQETRTLLYIFPAQKFAIAAAINFEGSSPGAYVDRLHQLLTDEPWAMQAYTADKTNAALYRGLYASFAPGMAYFDRYQKPFTESREELGAAFAYFNQALNPETAASDAAGALAKIRTGRHPASAHAFTKVGSYAAMKLKERGGANSFNAYAGAGAITFFNDYIELYKKDASIPQEFRFSEPVEKMLSSWNQSWAKTNTPYVRKLFLSEATLDEAATNLRKSFAGAQMYPNVLEPLLQIARQAALRGNRQSATKAGTLATELYPQDDTAMGTLGVIHLVFGERAQAETMLKKSLAMNPQGLASADGLNRMAYQLSGAGKAEQGFELLKLAIELHPKAANLYDTLGEFYMNKGEKQKAMEQYQKALEIDPKYPNAENARAIVKKLAS
ncbi:MAG: serine hydrolase [Pyrinomonadaceae bacterium]|nr:serine hydrolase [Pyrinomonadaceae bacterium]